MSSPTPRRWPRYTPSPPLFRAWTNQESDSNHESLFGGKIMIRITKCNDSSMHYLCYSGVNGGLVETEEAPEAEPDHQERSNDIKYDLPTKC